jgi:hypothetical protein
VALFVSIDIFFRASCAKHPVRCRSLLNYPNRIQMIFHLIQWRKTRLICHKLTSKLPKTNNRLNEKNRNNKFQDCRSFSFASQPLSDSFNFYFCKGEGLGISENGESGSLENESAEKGSSACERADSVSENCA